MRQSWDEYFLDIALKVATRSTCLRRKVGSVAVNINHRIIGTGYNGAPAGLSHCTKETCVRTKNNIPSGELPHICKAIHSEANIVLQLGDGLQNSTLYCTTKPCINCLKLLMGAQVRRIVWIEDYNDAYSDQLMLEYGKIVEHPGYKSLIRKELEDGEILLLQKLSDHSPNDIYHRL